MKWGFDLDGVIIDSYEVIREGLLNIFNVNFPKEKHISFKFDIPGVSGDETASVIARIVADGVNRCEPISGSIEALNEMYGITKEPINFITARTPKIERETHVFLRKHLKDIPYNLIMMAGIPKKDVIKELGITHYVDDRYKEIEMCLPFVEMGFIFDSPWNHGRTFSRENVVRIKSLKEILELI